MCSSLNRAAEREARGAKLPKNRHIVSRTSNARSSIQHPFPPLYRSNTIVALALHSHATQSNVRRRLHKTLAYFVRTPKIDTSPKTLQMFVGPRSGPGGATTYGVFKGLVVAPAGVRTARSLRSLAVCTALKNLHIILQTLNDRISSMWWPLRGVRRLMWLTFLTLRRSTLPARPQSPPTTKPS